MKKNLIPAEIRTRDPLIEKYNLILRLTESFIMIEINLKFFSISQRPQNR